MTLSFFRHIASVRWNKIHEKKNVLESCLLQAQSRRAGFVFLDLIWIWQDEHCLGKPHQQQHSPGPTQGALRVEASSKFLALPWHQDVVKLLWTETLSISSKKALLQWKHKPPELAGEWAKLKSWREKRQEKRDPETRRSGDIWDSICSNSSPVRTSFDGHYRHLEEGNLNRQNASIKWGCK